jgi:nucleoside phosphorylase
MGFGLMVGIGGGIPSKANLVDVVVSQRVADYHGVVQWDISSSRACVGDDSRHVCSSKSTIQ